MRNCFIIKEELIDLRDRYGDKRRYTDCLFSRGFQY